MALQFELVSPEKQLRSGTVHQVVVPGAEGDFAVLEGHAPMMSTIRAGAIEVYEAAGGPAERIFIEGGFAEVNETGLTILAERAEPVANIDAEQLTAEIERAEQRLARADNDSERAQAEKRLNTLRTKRDVAAN
ncbi:F0F1 ATP synthase subunit epsilon [Pacificimonas flava]|uniref:ATP synthase epsilon chain n=1 Tax=Pacificimonas flava TaxID=1234595 RepID=M2TPK0_9SPHN|nr:F0F1 ATP synthase subunit epsilon [Pacificimonas flava]EMD83701.1 ATP synthase epsilon chain [Pacificimonas flava]MBB5280617.1 F-type H+-transporting ATPase subunit epsilon [Pacificimonas flava]